MICMEQYSPKSRSSVSRALPKAEKLNRSTTYRPRLGVGLRPISVSANSASKSSAWLRS